MGSRAQRQWIAAARRSLARLALVVLGPVVVLGGAELLLRAAGQGHSTNFFIPADSGPDLLSNPRYGWPFFGEELSRPPLPCRLTRPKPPQVIRIFVLGGSAARGEPSPAFGLARTLEADLSLAHPGKRFEVVNTALTAANSHVVLPIAQECLHLEPDLLVVYLGNNEVVGPFGLGPLGGRWRAPWQIRLILAARSTRLGQLLERVVPRSDGPRGWDGMAMFTDHAVVAADPRLPGVRRAFRANLDRLCGAAARAGVPVVLATVATNTSDQPPLLSRHRAGLSPADSVSCAGLLAAADSSLAGGDATGALAAADAAAALDDGFAATQFLRGRSLAALGNEVDAREAFVLAAENDALRFRADAGINAAIRAAAAAPGVTLVDVAAALAAADHRALFLDHVHFSFAGNQALGALLQPAASEALGLAPAATVSDRAGAWLGFTAYDRWEAAEGILRITGRPPFAPAQGERDRARAAGLEQEARALPIAELLQTHANARVARPADPLLKEVQARLLQRLGRDLEAITLWSSLLGWYPDAPGWLVNRGEAQQHAGNTEAAVRDYRQALVIDPRQDTAQLRLAGILVQQGQTAEALELMDDLLSRMPDDERAQKLRRLIHSNRGN